MISDVLHTCLPLPTKARRARRWIERWRRRAMPRLQVTGAGHCLGGESDCRAETVSVPGRELLPFPSTGDRRLVGWKTTLRGPCLTRSSLVQRLSSSRNRWSLRLIPKWPSEAIARMAPPSRSISTSEICPRGRQWREIGSRINGRRHNTRSSRGRLRCLPRCSLLFQLSFLCPLF
jgi:hypothetical protein